MKYHIADLIVEMEPGGTLLSSRAKKYEYKGSRDADIAFYVSQKYYEDRNEEHKHMSLEECEYLWSGTFFYEQLINFNGVLLHASCVTYKGKAYLFSAPSGTGKSTHTHLWLKYLPGAEIVNDDKPAIRIIDGKAYAYGTPWSGKTDESINDGFPVGGICFLERGSNEIKRLPGIVALKNFMNQTVRPADKALMNSMLDTLNKILTCVPVYSMKCDISEEAVKMSFEAMSGDKIL